MSPDSEQLAAFRYQLSALRTSHEGWEASRHLVDETHLPATLQQLVDAAEKSSLPAPIKQTIGRVLSHTAIRRAKDLPGEQLRHLTGLPPTKAIRFPKGILRTIGCLSGIERVTILAARFGPFGGGSSR